MEHRIYEARIRDNDMVEISFFTGEVKELSAGRLLKYAEGFSALHSENVKIDNAVVSSNNKELKLGFLINGVDMDYSIDCDLLFEDGIIVERRTIDNVKVQLAGYLAAVRETMGMTQKDLESSTGIHQADISRIERGLGNPSLDTIVRLAAAMKHKVRIELVPDADLDPKYKYSGDIAAKLPRYKQQGEYTIRDINSTCEDFDGELINGFIYDKKPLPYGYEDIVTALYRMLFDYMEESSKELPHKHGKVFTGVYRIREDIDDECKSFVVPNVGIIYDKSKIIDDKWICGGVDFACVVLQDAQDLNEKKEKMALYKRLGIKELWVLDPQARQLDVLKMDDCYSNAYEYRDNDIVPVGIFDNRLTINLKGLWRFIEE